MGRCRERAGPEVGAPVAVLSCVRFGFPFPPVSFIFLNTLMHVPPHSGDDGPGYWSRRRFLARNALGLGSVALAWLLREENLLATPPNMPRQPQSLDLKPKVPLLR